MWGQIFTPDNAPLALKSSSRCFYYLSLFSFSTDVTEDRLEKVRKLLDSILAHKPPCYILLINSGEEYGMKNIDNFNMMFPICPQKLDFTEFANTISYCGSGRV